MSDHNAAYRWRELASTEKFSIQLSEDWTRMQLLRKMNPANADSMKGVEVLAEGDEVIALRDALNGI